MSRVNFRMILLALLALGITALRTFLSPTFSISQKAGILVFLVCVRGVISENPKENPQFSP